MSGEHATASDLGPGTILDGRYEIEAELGEGGIGKVYRGRHLRLDRPVAIKVLLTQHRDQSSLQARFEREAQALSSLSHPNIVTVTDFGIADGLPFLVMELVEGEDLSAVLSDGALPPKRAFAIARQILRSLAYAHDRGIVHRDLKPANVLLRVLPDGSDHVEVLDFGLAKFMDGSGPASDLTHTGAILGSPAYMSPEQAGGGKTDARTDVYAMGLILFELLSGSRPFRSKRISDLLRDHLVSTPPKLAEVVSGLAVEPALEALLSKALSKTPVERFADAGEMLSALEALGDGTARWTGAAAPTRIEDESATRAARPVGGGAGPKASAELGHLATMAATEAEPSPLPSPTHASSPELPARGGAVAPAAGGGQRTEELSSLSALASGATSGSYGSPSGTYVPVDAPKPFRFAAGCTAIGFIVLIAGILAIAFLWGDDEGAPKVEPSQGVSLQNAQEPTPSPAAPSATEEPTPSAARKLLEAVVGGDSGGRDPWAQVPEALASYRAQVAAGRPLRRAQVRSVRDYGRANPSDPRSFLLLGRSYTLDRALSYAVPEYQQALELDASAIGDRQILGDLLEAARSRSQARNASQLIQRYWGKQALSAIDAELAGDLRGDERKRIEALRNSL